MRCSGCCFLRRKSSPASSYTGCTGRGEKKSVDVALKEALGTMLTSLSIDRCSIALQDVVTILVSTPTLDSLEVRDVVPDNDAGEPILPTPPGPKSKKRISANSVTSLTITSYTKLDNLFTQVSFPRLFSLSLRLQDDSLVPGKDSLLSSAFDGVTPAAKPAREFDLRGRLSPPWLLKEYKDSLGSRRVDFHLEHLA
ncbi:hypothetical protein NMY22_g17172 [Coprinellus aureogranulatus]|nr:hypothetical protein NMY22_g17172 [Coprinellus aureogranulatus]